MVWVLLAIGVILLLGYLFLRRPRNEGGPAEAPTQQPAGREPAGKEPAGKEPARKDPARKETARKGGGGR